MCKLGRRALASTRAESPFQDAPERARHSGVGTILGSTPTGAADSARFSEGAGLASVRLDQRIVARCEDEKVSRRAVNHREHATPPGNTRELNPLVALACGDRYRGRAGSPRKRASRLSNHRTGRGVGEAHACEAAWQDHIRRAVVALIATHQLKDTRQGLRCQGDFLFFIKITDLDPIEVLDWPMHTLRVQASIGDPTRRLPFAVRKVLAY
jgi:hypothetical protein